MKVFNHTTNVYIHYAPVYSIFDELEECKTFTCILDKTFAAGYADFYLLFTDYEDTYDKNCKESSGYKKDIQLNLTS